MNKKIYNEDLVLNLIVNGDKLQPGNTKLLNELHKLDQASHKLYLRRAELELQKKQLDKSDTAYASKLKSINMLLAANQKQLDANSAAMMKLRMQIGITGMTVNQLNTHLKVLKTTLANATDPKLMKRLRHEIEETQIRLTYLTTGAGRLSQAWTRLAKEANRYSAAIGWISIVAFGVGNAIGNLVTRLGLLDRKLSGVMKTTNLTREEANRLKRDFDKMQTPTKTDDLLDMAKIAGRLGLEGYDNIKKFTSAIDVLYTALGDDLNLSVQETAEKVGKLVNAFRVTDKLPIDEALLRTGSLLNQLDKSSVASAGTILEYMTRLSSLGTTANYPMEQIAGLAATLETVNIPAERGSTALRNIINGMGKYSEKFARVLGMDLKDYMRAIETDINGVFLELIKRTSEGDKSISDIVESMGDFEITGVRVQEVYGALAQNLDIVTKQQAIATKAFASTASVMAEYNIITKDFQGSIDLQKKRVTALADEFNLKLRPAAYSAYKMWVDFLYAIRDLSHWIYVHQNAIKALAALYVVWKSSAIGAWISGVAKAVAQYTVALWANMKATVSNNAVLLAFQRHGIKGLIVAFRQLWATMLLNPMGPIVAVIGAVAAAFYMLSGKIDIVKEAMSDLQKEIIDQRGQMEALFDAAEQSAIGTDKHKAAIQALNEVYAKYLPNQLSEVDNLDAITAAREQAIAAMEKEIALKWQNEQFAKLEERNVELRKNAAERLLGNLKGKQLGAASMVLDEITQSIMSKNSNMWYANEAVRKNEIAGRKGTYSISDLTSGFLKDFGLENQASRDAMREYVNLLLQMREEKAKIDEFTKGYLSGGKSSAPTDLESSGGPLQKADPVPMTEKEFDEAVKAEDKAFKEHKIIINNKKQTDNEFKIAELKAEIEHTDRLIAIHERYAAKDTKDLDDLLVQKSELSRKLREEGVNQAEEREKENEERARERENEIKELVEAESDKWDRVMAAKKLAFTKGEMDAVTYNREILQLEADKWRAIQALQENNLADSSETQQKVADAELAIRKNTLKEMEDAAEKWLADEKLRIEKQYSGDISQKEKYENELLLSEITYQEMLLNIRKQAGEDTADIELKLHQLRKELMQDNIDTAENAEKELTRIFGKKNGYVAKYIALSREIKKVEEDSLLTADQKKAKTDTYIKAQEQLTEVEAVRVATQIAGDIATAQSAQEATVIILNSIRDKIAAYAAEAIAKAVAAEAGKGIIGVITATAAAAAFALLFNTLVPKFGVNSETGKVEGKTMSWKPQGTKQQYAGKYPVVGADDHRSYLAEWMGNAQTGIYGSPALIAERGPEMVVDYPTLRNMQMNAPGLIDAIMAMRVPQYGNGRYESEMARGREVAASQAPRNDSARNDEIAANLAMTAKAVSRLNETLKKGITAKVNKYGTNGLDESIREISEFNAKINKK